VAPILCKTCNHPISGHYKVSEHLESPSGWKRHDCHVCDKERTVVVADSPSRRQQGVAFIGLLAFEFLIAILIKASHATGSAALLLYLIPVLIAFVYYINKYES
jgi:hypothetical protein